MRVFSNYQLILLIFIFMSTILVSKSINYDNMDTLYDFQSLQPGFGLVSKSGKNKMDYGKDGTLNIIRLKTDRDGNMQIDRRTGMPITENVWGQGQNPGGALAPNPGGAGPLTLANGILSIYNSSGENLVKQHWWGQTPRDEDGGSKLVMLDTGLLVLFNSAGGWAANWPEYPAEGYENYTQDIANKRDELQKQTSELLRLKSNENKPKMDWSILVNILWTVIATSMLYYLISN